MAQSFKTAQLILTKQVVSATGDVLFVNGVPSYLGVSGNLTQTGVAIEAQLISLSGWASGQFYLSSNPQQYARSGDLTQSGVLIEGQINSLSGYGNNTFATISSLFSTGANLYILSVNESGALSSIIAFTGQTLFQDLMGFSGQANINYAPALANYLYQTGAQNVSGTKTFTTGVGFNQNLSFPSVNVTGNFNFMYGFYRYNWTGASGSPNIWTGILPSVSIYSGLEFQIKNRSDSTGIYISGNIDNANGFIVYSYDMFTFWSDGQTWNIG